MFRLILLLAVAATVMQTGCRICSDCGDQDYPTIGGAYQRTVRDRGRVGSVFDPAGGVSSLLVNRDDPTDINVRDELESEESVDDSDAADDDQLDSLEDGFDADEQTDDGDEDLPSLEDVEDDRSRGLRELELEDIQVKLVPRRGGSID